jgi:hypothetical protein
LISCECVLPSRLILFDLTNQNIPNVFSAKFYPECVRLSNSIGSRFFFL